MRHLNRSLAALALALLPLTVLAQTTPAAKPPATKPAAATVQAEAGAAVGDSPRLQGKSAGGKAFNLATLKGKVVLLMFWSTDCPVCRDKMPELRENYQGWAGKPFELVLVSVDKRMKDVDDYEAVINRMVPLRQRFVQLWAGEAGYTDSLGTAQLARSQLPMTYLMDKSGKVVAKFAGRIPAEAWDQIAELL
jgi:cytochrome oxidase Cu insertion factor (SCO1/SenC/PrrC family)